MTIEQDIQAPSPGVKLAFYILDTTTIIDNDGNPGVEIFRFHAGVNGLNADVTWQGQVYTRMPMEASEFSLEGKGILPRPKVTVSNVGGFISGLCRKYADLVGAKFTRKRTYDKYLDAVNFPGGVNPTADPNQHYPDDVFFVDRKASENPIYCLFELCAPWDVIGLKLPGRQIIRNICPAPTIYRGPLCGYAGGPVAKADDTPTSDSSQDVCGKRLKSCKLRFGENNPLPFGGFPNVL